MLLLMLTWHLRRPMQAPLARGGCPPRFPMHNTPLAAQALFCVPTLCSGSLLLRRAAL